MSKEPPVGGDAGPSDRPAPRPATPTAVRVPDGSRETEERKIPRHDDPTRYGDWEIGGRCIDF